MCKAFSCIATRKKVYWKLGMDSHNDISEHFKLKDDVSNNFCPVEIVPKNNNYIEPDEWVFNFDDKCPDWWKQSNEEMCWDAKKQWYDELMKKVYKNRIKNLINPFELPIIKQVTKTDINNLKKWDSIGDSIWDSIWDSIGDSVRDSIWNSVGNSVGDSIWNSVGNSIWDSIGDSVRDSVGDSVRDSIGDSIYGYVGYMFKLERSEWKYTNKIKTKSYPFISLIKLWKRGLVPSFDGNIWRLHSGKKAKIVFEISKKELNAR